MRTLLCTQKTEKLWDEGKETPRVQNAWRNCIEGAVPEGLQKSENVYATKLGEQGIIDFCFLATLYR